MGRYEPGQGRSNERLPSTAVGDEEGEVKGVFACRIDGGDLAHALPVVVGAAPG
jgi:hypothetical protein